MKRGCLGTGALVVGALFSIGLSAIGIAMLVSPPRYIDFTCDRATETCVIDNHVVRRSFPFADIDKVRTHHGFSRGNGASNALELLLKMGARKRSATRSSTRNTLSTATSRTKRRRSSASARRRAANGRAKKSGRPRSKKFASSSSASSFSASSSSSREPAARDPLDTEPAAARFRHLPQGLSSCATSSR